MEIKKAMKAYSTQKANAKRRGIEFNLTFKQWCEFWGADIQKRGNGHDKLQMQRIADTGPYEIGNIKKGYPRQNAETHGKMRAIHSCNAAREEIELALDSAIWGPSADPMDGHEVDPDLLRLGYSSSYWQRFNFRG